MAGDAAQFPMFCVLFNQDFSHFPVHLLLVSKDLRSPSVGKSGSGDSGGRGCIYFQMLQGWSALISSHALAGMRGHCAEDAAAAGSQDRGMFNAPGRVNESIFVQM